MRNKKAVRHIEKNSKITEVSPSLSLIHLMVKHSIKRQILAEWVKNDMF